ncbi:MAG: TetR/AcrR family transcriptional regulator [Thermodesulfobacteriota bacterium]
MNRDKADLKKGEIAREKIMEAARRVFAKLPYNVASLRMIAKEGGFDHPLIRYYFPTKADLFAAVVERLVEEFYQAHFTWLEGLDTMPAGQGFKTMLSRVVDYDEKNPDAMRIIMQNLPQVDRLDSIPGYQLVPMLFETMRSTYLKKVPLSGPEEEVEMFFSTFFATIVNGLGGSTAYSQHLNLSPAEYRNWLKEAFSCMYIPWLVRLTIPGNRTKGM